MDYWDRLGWKDPFANKDFTLRQRKYAAVNKSRNIYTPQLIVNGQVGVERRISKVIQESLKAKPKSQVSVQTKISNNTVAVNYTVKGQVAAGDSVHFAMVERGLKSNVKRGENKGKKLSHENVVRVFKSIKLDGKNNSGNVTLTLPASLKVENSSIIAYLQDGKSWLVKGATLLDLKTK